MRSCTRLEAHHSTLVSMNTYQIPQPYDHDHQRLQQTYRQSKIVCEKLPEAQAINVYLPIMLPSILLSWSHQLQIFLTVQPESYLPAMVKSFIRSHADSIREHYFRPALELWRTLHPYRDFLHVPLIAPSFPLPLIAPASIGHICCHRSYLPSSIAPAITVRCFYH